MSTSRLNQIYYMKFRSKIDLWVVVALILIVALPVGLPLFYAFSWIMLGVAVITGAILWSVTFGISYVVTDQKLLIRCGPLRLGQVDIMKITVIESTGSMSAAPAASSDRIAVYYKGSRQAVVISPDDRKGFIDLVKAINPDVTLRL